MGFDTIRYRVDEKVGRITQDGPIFASDRRFVELDGFTASSESPLLCLFHRRGDTLYTVAISSVDEDGKTILDLRTSRVRESFSYSQREAPGASVVFDTYLVKAESITVDPNTGKITVTDVKGIVANGMTVVKWSPINIEADGSVASMKGPKGEDGKDGKDGKSAYQLAKEANPTSPSVINVFTWLESLRGEKGDNAYDVYKTYELTQGREPLDKGSWLDSLKGKSAYQLACEVLGFTGSEEDWLASLHGLSAYEIAVKYGYEYGEHAWLDTLKGPKGDPGRDGDVTESRARKIAQEVASEAIDGKIEDLLVTVTGLPSGGHVREVLTKTGDGDYDLEWRRPSDNSAVHYTDDTTRDDIIVTDEMRSIARANIDAAASDHGHAVSDIDGLADKLEELSSVPDLSEDVSNLDTRVTALEDGTTGGGLPEGGDPGQVLGKNENNEITWINQSGGVTSEDLSSGLDTRIRKVFAYIDSDCELEISCAPLYFDATTDIVSFKYNGEQIDVSTISLGGTDSTNIVMTFDTGSTPSVSVTIPRNKFVYLDTVSSIVNKAREGELSTSGGTMTGSIKWGSALGFASIEGSGTTGSIDFSGRSSRAMGATTKTSSLIPDGTQVATRNYVASQFASTNTSLTGVIEDYCPYPANAVTTGATLSAGAISVYTPTASETAATFTLPVPSAGKTADVVVMVDCTDASPRVSAALPDGKTAIWLDAAEALTYESGFVYQQIYTIVPAEVDDTYYVTFAEQKLTKRAST